MQRTSLPTNRQTYQRQLIASLPRFSLLSKHNQRQIFPESKQNPHSSRHPHHTDRPTDHQPQPNVIMDENRQGTDTHPHSEKQTNTDKHKGTTAFAAITDPKFPLPALTSNSSTLRYILSFGTLLGIMACGIGGAWYLGLEILQSSQPLVMGIIVSAIALVAFWVTGTIWVDWFELVIGYWWLSMPIGALVGIAVVLNAEASATMVETD